MYTLSHHNTTNETRDTLTLMDAKARSLEDKIETLFLVYRQPTSPSGVKRALDKAFKADHLLTSIRRGMTNLTTNSGILERLDIKVKGMYGRPEHLWDLRKGQLRFL